MVNRIGTWTLASIAAMSGIVGGARADVVVLEDHFSYADSAALQAVWGRADTTAPNSASATLATTFTSTAASKTPDPQPAHLPAMSLTNGVVFTNLTQTVTDDWTLSFKMLSSTYSRFHAVGVLNAAGTQGYGTVWETTAVTQNSGQGVARLRKFDLATAWDNHDTTGTNLSTSAATGHPATGYAYSGGTYGDTFSGFAEWTLSWTKATGRLAVSVNGVERTSVIDTSFSSFSRVYIRGNDRVYIDDMVMTVVPEPATLALAAAGLALSLARPRR